MMQYDVPVNPEAALVLRFAKNRYGTDYVAGDIHGEYHKLQRKLAGIGFDRKRDRLFCVGDLVDRGADSEAVVQCLKYDWFYSVCGNHEEMIVNAAQYGLSTWFYMNGGEWWLSSDAATQTEIAGLLSTLPLVIEIDTDNGTVGIVHADMPLGMNWALVIDRLIAADQEVRDCLLWSRKRILEGVNEPVTGIGHVYCGHTPVPKPVHIGNMSFIDTGACYGGDLTILPISASACPGERAGMT